MGPYRLALFLQAGLGLNMAIELDLNRCIITVGPVVAYVSWDQYARGYRIFKD